MGDNSNPNNFIKKFKLEKYIIKRRKHMIVDKEGKLFEDRRKSTDRRKSEGKSSGVKKDRRKDSRRKENNKGIRKSSK